MPTLNPELSSYVQNALAAGSPPQAIRASLIAAGWAAADVEAAFNLPTGNVAAPGKKKNAAARIIAVAAAVVLVIGAGATYYLMINKKPTPDAAPAAVKNAPLNTPAPAADAGGGGTVEAKGVVVLDDADLVLPSHAVADSDNGYLDEKILKAVVTKSALRPNGDATDARKALSGEAPWDQAFVSDIVKNNQGLITAFASAVGRRDFQVPPLSNPAKAASLEVGAIDYSLYRDMATVVLLDAVSRAKNNDAANGAAEALAVAAYGQRMATSMIDEAGYSTGLLLKQMGLNAFQKIFAGSSLASADAVRADGLLASFSDTGPSLATAFKISYWLSRNEVIDLVKNPAAHFPEAPAGQFSDPKYLDANKTIDLMAEAARKRIGRTKESCREFSDTPVDQATIDDIAKMQGDNAYGRSLVSGIGSADAMILNKRCADLALVVAVRASLAPLISKGQ